jgi:hypothetical protein
MATLSFERPVRAPEHVLMRELAGEAVLLNLDSEIYYGLDETGTRMWQALTGEPTIQAAYDALLAEYDVAPEVLRQDVEELLGRLLEHGLLELADG